jgi:2,4-dienoyl-CoA reductase (NADPH2)
MSSTGYKRLSEQTYIGSCKLRNRIVKTGASMWYWDENETHMNSRTLAFYEAIAKGGVGMLIVEAPTVDYPQGARWHCRYRIDDDKYLPGMKELADAIHKYSCPAFMQMIHEGPWMNPLFPTQEPVYVGPPIGASDTKLDLATDMHRDAPHPLTVEEIHALVEKFASAAVRIKKAGFDGIDINAASSHLFHNFLSPFWNKRTDEYGGSVENRSRFLTEVVKEIKYRNGAEFPVMVCMNGIEMGQAIGIENSTCLTFDDAKRIAVLLEEAGVDAIHVRSHWLGYHQGGYLPDKFFYPEPPVPVSQFPEEYYTAGKGVGANRILSGELKKILKIPVLVVGRLDAKLGEQLVSEGKADLIGMTRRLFADPEYPDKVLNGRESEVAPCSSCLTCLDPQRVNRRCRINAFMGTDQPYQITPAHKKKKVLVVGGGPGGMAAARTAAIRGHEVVLFEKAGNLGGLLPLASLVKGLEFEDIPAVIKYYVNQLEMHHVKVRLYTKATVENVLAEKPDAVIIATGGILGSADVKGIKNRVVVDNVKLHAMLKLALKIFPIKILGMLTNIWMPLGKNVVILGGSMHGCELGEFFVRRNRRVTILETGDTLGLGIVPALRRLLVEWFERKGVKMLTGVKDIEVIAGGVKAVTKEGETVTFRADSVVPAVPSVPDPYLYVLLKGRVPELYAVGDCKEPLLIVDAIAAGTLVARDI